jgi:cell division protein YceG involved in septum cleavage
MFFRQKFPYILLGIGIGILLTNIIYNFYPKVEYKEYSQEEIIERAKELGMVFLKDVIKVDSPPEDKGKPKEIEFIVKKGDSLIEIANNLYDAGIIEDVDSFVKYVKDKKLDKKIRVGSFMLSPYMNYDEIIDVLLKRKIDS